MRDGHVYLRVGCWSIDDHFQFVVQHTRRYGGQVGEVTFIIAVVGLFKDLVSWNKLCLSLIIRWIRQLALGTLCSAAPRQPLPTALWHRWSRRFITVRFIYFSFPPHGQWISSTQINEHKRISPRSTTSKLPLLEQSSIAKSTPTIGTKYPHKTLFLQ